MKLRYFIPTLMTVVAAVFTGCSDDKDPTYLDGLRVSQSYVALTEDGKATSITINSADSWNFDESTIPEWLTITPKSGSAGEGTITFSAERTESTRNCELLLNSAGKTQRINVMQYAEETTPVIMSVSEALTMINSNTMGTKAHYVRGVVCKIQEISPSYGNATYYLSDDGSFKDGTWLQVYRGKWINNENFTTGNEFAVGDELVIKGVLINYNGNTPETQQGACEVISVSKSLIKIDSLSIADATLPQEGGDLSIILSCKGDGVSVEIPQEAKDWLFITSIISGNTPEVKLRALENTGADREANITFKTSSNGKDYTVSTTVKQAGLAKGSGTDSDPFNVAGAIGYTKKLGADVVSESDIYVKGIISSIKYTYSAEFGTATYNISDDGTENGVFTVYGSYYFDYQPWVEGNEQVKVGDEVIVVGKTIYYKGTTPEFNNKQNCLFSLNGKTSSKTASVAEFLAAAEDDTRYSLSGVESSLYDSDKQGKSFYIKDFSGETLVYRTEGFLDSGIKVGDVVTVVGKRGSYKDNAQMVNGNCSLEHAVTEISIADFLQKPDDKNTWYMVTGVITSLKDNKGRDNDYGNLYLSDGTNELYVYGCYPGWGATGDNRKFFIADNEIEVGDKLTMIGYKDTYNGLVELCGGVCFGFAKANAE